MKQTGVNLVFTFQVALFMQVLLFIEQSGNDCWEEIRLCIYTSVDS